MLILVGLTWFTQVVQGAPGRFKSWINQHSILPQMLWPLLVYTVPITTVKSLERNISVCQKGLGHPRSLTCRTSNTLCLPFRGLTEEFKVACTREALQCRDSRDCKVSLAGINVKIGRKRKVQDGRKHWWAPQL